MNKTITSRFGYQQITSLSSATGLTVPSVDKNGLAGKPVVAFIKCATQPVRWRDDDVAPTTTVGWPLAVGETLEYDGDLTKIKFIETTASAALDIVYYG